MSTADRNAQRLVAAATAAVLIAGTACSRSATTDAEAGLPASSPSRHAPAGAPSAADRLGMPSRDRDRTAPAGRVRRGAAIPPFEGAIATIGRDVRSRMGTSWRPGCPVHLRDLRVLTLGFWGFDGRVHRGELIVHREWARPVLGAFRTIYEARYPIERMEVANGYMGDDPPLAQVNDTVGFNCRPSVSRRGVWSQHAYGRAVDVNPVQNPYIGRTGRILPPAGAAFVDRTRAHPAVIRADGVVVRAFRSIGWRWGGTYRRSKDYHHFSATGV